jgi:hypothetical protein
MRGSLGGTGVVWIWYFSGIFYNPAFLIISDTRCSLPPERI